MTNERATLADVLQNRLSSSLSQVTREELVKEVERLWSDLESANVDYEMLEEELAEYKQEWIDALKAVDQYSAEQHMALKLLLSDSKVLLNNSEMVIKLLSVCVLNSESASGFAEKILSNLYNVYLCSYSCSKIDFIKTLRGIRDLGLREITMISNQVEKSKKTVFLSNVSQSIAKSAVRTIEASGGKAQAISLSKDSKETDVTSNAIEAIS